MRTILLITATLMLICTGWAQDLGTGTRTEEYAVISAWQSGKKTRISVQIGSETTPDKEFEAEKGDKRFDMSPVIREMEALNSMDFELVTGNSAVVPVSANSIWPFYTFVFKRRIQ